MDSKKMMKAAGTLDSIVNILGGICRAIGIVLLIFALLVLIFGEKMFDMGTFSLDVDFVKIYLADEYKVATKPLIGYVCVGMAGAGMMCFMMFYAAKIVRKILAPMKAGRPFETDIPGNIRKIAWLTLIGGVAVQAIRAAEHTLLTKAYPMDAIFASDAVAKFEYTYAADFNFVPIFCVIMFLSYIFAYGQKLQQESDETL